MMITAVGQNVYLSNEKFEIGRNFLTKIWNAARFMQMYSKDFSVSASQAAGEKESIIDIKNPTVHPELLRSDDKHILARLHETIASCTENLEWFRFNDVAKKLYDFVWHQFCDWYIEYAKIILNSNDDPSRKQVVQVMHYVFSNALRLLHPFIPFITEELWHELKFGKEDLIVSAWPTVEEKFIREDVKEKMDFLKELIISVRHLRTDANLKPRDRIHIKGKTANPGELTLIRTYSEYIKTLTRADDIEISEEKKDKVALSITPTQS